MDEMDRLIELRKQGFFCSQILILLGLELQGKDNPDLVRAMHALAGGLGFTGETCGSLMGGASLLGLYAGKGAPGDEDDPRLIFMVEDLEFTAAMVGVTSIVTSVTSLLVQRRVGVLSDRWGPRKVQLISMLLIPSLPFLWMFITQFWQVVVLNAFGGIIWGAFNLVAFNFLLSITPDAQRARYSAIYQVTITLALAGGAAFGSWVISQWSFQGVFLASAVVRLIAGFLFARYVPDILRKKPPKAPAEAGGTGV